LKQSLSSFYEETRSARKIVVVDFGFLGDTVHLIPPLRALLQNYPQAELHVVTTPVGAEILKMTPCHESLGLVRQLRAQRFDALFNFSGADRTVYLSAALGVRRKISQTPARWHFYNALLSR
jgi:ADP-heptose:LPS heptosyltransferase